MISLYRLGLYLGIGALFHALFVGAHFDWSSAWTWVWLVCWPVMLVITFWVIIAVIIIATLVVVGAVALWGQL
jgi:hypothetical protein